MEQDKTKKIILIVLIVLLSVIIITVGIFILIKNVLLNNDKSNTSEEELEIIYLNSTTEVFQDDIIKKTISEEQLSLTEAYNLYNQASYIYWGNERYFKIKQHADIVTNEETGEERYLCEVTNFSEVMDEYFTEDGKEQYANTVTSLLIKDGKAYAGAEGRAANPAYYSTELVLENEDENEVEYTAKSTYLEDEVLSQNEGTEVDFSKYSEDDFYTVEKPFRLVYDGEKWKIDSFTLPN